MAANLPFPVERLALQRTVRLVATARLREPAFRRLGSQEFQDDLTEIDSATSGRLTARQWGTEAIGHQEFVAGLPYAHFINAAFAHWRPQELNRFNGPGRGAWYAALEVGTCIAEVSFHMTRELERVNDFNATVDYAELLASFAGEFVDLRQCDAGTDCLNPDPDIGYPAGNGLAGQVRAVGHNGIIHGSVRDPEGTCLVALWPHAVQSVAEGNILRLKWSRQRTPAVEPID